jgi:5-methyltetrahydrofolate--homocysteine methyltransferase
LITSSRDFILVGENIHATRVIMRKGERIAVDDNDDEGIVFVDESGAIRHLRIPDQEKRTQPYQEGRVKHVKVAVEVAMAGDEPDRSVALSYLRTLAQREVKAGAKFLDVNVDEISVKLANQIEAMCWLVRTLAPLFDIPLSIDSSNLEIISAGVATAQEVAGARVGPPMLNSASLERIEALELAAELKGAVIVTAAGQSGMPTNAEERVANASRMIEASLAAGIPLDRIFVDPLVFPIAVDGEYGRHCLGAISELRRRYGQDIHITGGMSNVSFGLPNRRLLNDAFLFLAIECGADSGIVDPTVVDIQQILAADRTARPIQLALNVLSGADLYCREYVTAHRAGELAAAS